MTTELYPCFSAREFARRHAAARALIESAALGRGGLPDLYYISSGPHEGSSVRVPRQATA